MPPRTTRRRIGRPPALESTETRTRILEAARTCFGRLGFDRTTNKDVADAAGITTGAIYHYFDSKQALFTAVSNETSAYVGRDFRAALEIDGTIVDKLQALLDRAIALHQSDRSLATFLTVAPMEVQRHEELRTGLDDGPDLLGLLREQITGGKRRGEVAADVDEDVAANMLMASMMGLAQFGALVESADVHRDIARSFGRLIEGSLFTLVPSPDGETYREAS